MCYCACEAPDFYRLSWPKAKKEYRCIECHYPIQPREKYQSYVGKWDGEMDTFRTCTRCAHARDAIEGLSEECICFGGLVEVLRDRIK